MERDTEVLLSLLAVRLLGGKVSPDDPVLKKIKDWAKKAQDQGLLSQVMVVQTGTSVIGKVVRRQLKLLELTPEGERRLRAAADPETLAATTHAHLSALRQSLEADRHSLRHEVLAALAAKGQSKGVSEQDVKKLSETVAQVGERLKKLEDAVGAGHPVLNQIDQAFGALLARLDKAVSGQASHGSNVSAPVSAGGEPPPAL